MSPRAFLAALFGGGDDQVLTGRVSEPDWWAIVAARLRVGPDLLAELPCDALFIDDTPGHVTAAESLGMIGHLHTSTVGTITRIEAFLEH
jgi:hypothetical protein